MLAWVKVYWKPKIWYNSQFSIISINLSGGRKRRHKQLVEKAGLLHIVLELPPVTV